MVAALYPSAHKHFSDSIIHTSFNHNIQHLSEKMGIIKLFDPAMELSTSNVFSSEIAFLMIIDSNV